FSCSRLHRVLDSCPTRRSSDLDFVQARLGLVVGPSPEMARLVRDHGLGAVTDGFTSADLATTLAGITADDVRRWKAASHTAARELCAEPHTGACAEMVGALADAARGR